MNVVHVRWTDLVILASVPCVLLVSAFFGLLGAPAIVLATTLLGMLALAYAAERSRPSLRTLMPTVVLAALAAAGRVLFAPLPDIKPVSAIVILAGSVLGSRSGFATGALAALVSNAFFGQGPWTPLQMYAWGVIGYLAGVLSQAGVFRRRRSVLVYGFLSGLLYGAIMNAWHVVGFVRPLTWQSVIITFVAGVPWDLMHGGATVAFLLGIWEPWSRALRRVVLKFDLREASQLTYERAPVDLPQGRDGRGGHDEGEASIVRA